MGTTKLQVSKPVLKLVQTGVCSTTDIKVAISEAEKLSTPESQEKIRAAEKMFGAVGEVNRIKILMLLSKRGEMCVCELESALKLPQPTISHHLALLEQSGLLERYKRARWVFYKLKENSVVDLLRKMILK